MSKRKQTTPRPPRTRNRFRERELARVVRAVEAGGGGHVELDPATGKYVIIVGGKPGAEPSDNEVENWLSKQKD
jgi:hypothetical protein